MEAMSNHWISKVSVSKSTVHISLPQELEDGFERSLGASPMTLMNPTVALQLNDGQLAQTLGLTGRNGKQSNSWT